MKFMMLACCAVMAMPVVGWVAAGGLSLGLEGGLAALLPLAGCLALHGAMFLFMGRSCHGAADDVETAESADAPDVTKVPSIAPQAAREAAEAA